MGLQYTSWIWTDSSCASDQRSQELPGSCTEPVAYWRNGRNETTKLPTNDCARRTVDSPVGLASTACFVESCHAAIQPRQDTNRYKHRDAGWYSSIHCMRMLYHIDFFRKRSLECSEISKTTGAAGCSLDSEKQTSHCCDTNTERATVNTSLPFLHGSQSDMATF